MFRKTQLALLASMCALAVAFSAPVSAHQKKPQFTRISAAARIVADGQYMKVCMAKGDGEVCKRAYLRGKNRGAGPLFSKIRSGKNTFKVNNRYWQVCDVYGYCTTVYAGTGG